MKIAMMGSGGLGSFYGAMLARAGEDVRFIARGERLQALRGGGLHVESEHVGDFQLARVNATDDPATVGPVDAVLIGVKAYDLEAASHAIQPLLGPETTILPLLNGIDIAERIGAVVGEQRVLGCTVFLSSNLIAPGHVRHVFNGPLLFGELAGGTSPRSEALEAVLQGAGINAQRSDAIRRELWNKYIIVSPLAAVSTTTRLATRRVAAHPATRGLFRAVSEEVAALARASGVDIDPEAAERAVAFIEGVSEQHTVSTLLDLRAGRRLELDAMVGAVVRLGERLGVPTPVSAVLHALLLPHADGAPDGDLPG